MEKQIMLAKLVDGVVGFGNSSSCENESAQKKDN